MQNSHIFDPDEFERLCLNIRLMQGDIRLQYEETLDASHYGHPEIVQTTQTGNRGRPRIHIDPVFLRWAYSQRTTSGIARFLHVGRSTVRNALIDYGITEPQSNPFPNQIQDGSMEPGDFVEDHLLDPDLPLPTPLSDEILASGNGPVVDLPSPATVSFTGPVSSILDSALDDLIRRLRSHYRRAGISMLDGMLRRLGHRIPRDRIRESLMRIDPIQRVFQCIRIRRRVYSVPGPNSLWHHDGQHGMTNSLSFQTQMNTYCICRSYPVGYCDPWFY
jgi:hypothetical protein